MKIIRFIHDWSEVWALLIPLIIILLHRPRGDKSSWLVAYVIVAFLLNITSTSMAQFYGSMPSWLKNNNILYNIHSVVRVLLLGAYIITVRPYKYPGVLKGLFAAYMLFIILNFSFLEPVNFLSPNLYAAESIMLLTLCLLYFFRSIEDDSDIHWLRHPSFLVCTGICFYEVITFFVFLFFNTINYSTEHRDRKFAQVLMLIYTLSYVILCILLAIALYRDRKNQRKTAFDPESPKIL